MTLDTIEPDCCRYLAFGRSEGLPFPITGMSDVMPYESSRFCALSDEELNACEAAFARRITEAVETFRPDIIQSHHLWIVTSLTRLLFPAIPMVTNCHGSDLRQFQNCGHLRERVLAGCRGLDAVMSLSRAHAICCNLGTLLTNWTKYSVGLKGKVYFVNNVPYFTTYFTKKQNSGRMPAWRMLICAIPEDSTNPSWCSWASAGGSKSTRTC